jgi:hypothetical protein
MVGFVVLQVAHELRTVEVSLAPAAVARHFETQHSSRAAAAAALLLDEQNRRYALSRKLGFSL